MINFSDVSSNLFILILLPYGHKVVVALGNPSVTHNSSDCPPPPSWLDVTCALPTCALAELVAETGMGTGKQTRLSDQTGFRGSLFSIFSH